MALSEQSSLRRAKAEKAEPRVVTMGGKEVMRNHLIEKDYEDYIASSHCNNRRQRHAAGEEKQKKAVINEFFDLKLSGKEEHVCTLLAMSN